MRRHLDEFSELLATMTQTSPVDQSLYHVHDVAVKLEQTQSVLAELLLELSRAAAADRHPAQHTGICFTLPRPTTRNLSDGIGSDQIVL